MKKRILSAMLALVMVLSMIPAAVAAGAFTDVADGDWFADEVKYVYKNGLMNGVGDDLFAPYDNVSRAMMWTTLARIAGVNTKGGDLWYELGQKWAVRSDVSDGTGALDNVTREQLVTMLYRYAGSPELTAADYARLAAYPDADKVSAWAEDAVAWALKEGILNGMDGKLNPQGSATRAQLAAILYRYVELVLEAEKEEEKKPVVIVPSHTHSYTYTSNYDGTHQKSCSCGTATEECGEWVDSSVCEKCGYNKDATYLIPETASAVLDKAESGIYILTAGDYGTITMDEGDLNRNGIIIMAEGAVTVENLILKDSIEVADITIQGITFDGVSGTGKNTGIIVNSVDGLTIIDCDFVNGSGINCGETHALSDVLIQNCTFDQTNAGAGSTYSPIYLSADLSGTVEIKNNEFTNSVYNGISLNGGDITADVTISDNTIDTTADRGLRLGTVANGGSVAFVNNELIDAADGDGEVFKVGIVEAGASVTFEGNTYDDVAWDPADISGAASNVVYSVPVYLTPENASAVLDKAETGIYILTAGDYGTITMDDGDLNRNGIIIMAEGAVTVENLILKDSIEVADITIQGITFDGVSGTGKNTGIIVNSVDGLTVIDCDFVNGSGINCSETHTLSDVLIQDCTFDQTNAGEGSTYSPIYLSADLSGTVEIKNNEFTNSVYNGISLNGGDITADVTISDNTIDTTADRGLRLGTVANGGSVAFVNNELIDAADGDGEVFKVGSVETGASVTFEGNTYDAVAWDPADISGAASNIAYSSSFAS